MTAAQSVVAQTFAPALKDAETLLHDFVLADHDGTIKQQVGVALELGNVINLARPLVKLYLHYTRQQSTFATCLMDNIKCLPAADRARFADTCQAAVVQYVHMMHALQQFVSEGKPWQPAMQHLFEAMYITVEDGQFKTLMQLFALCQQGGAGCTVAVMEALQHVESSNLQFVALSTRFIEVLQAPPPSPPSMLTVVMRKFFTLIVYVLLYVSQLVGGILVQLAGPATFDDPAAIKKYRYFLDVVQTLMQKYAPASSASFLATLFAAFAPPTVQDVKFTFNFQDPLNFTVDRGGWLLQITQLLYHWDQNVLDTVQHYIAKPVLASGLALMLSHARSRFTGFSGGAIVAAVGAALKFMLPSAERAFSFVIAHVILPIVIPIVTSYTAQAASYAIRRVSKYLRLDAWGMQKVLSAVPASATPAVLSPKQTKDMLKFLDDVVSENRTSWAYGTLQWFARLIKRDVKHAKKLVGYKCVQTRGTKQCVPLLADASMPAGHQYFLNYMRCLQKCV